MTIPAQTETIAAAGKGPGASALSIGKILPQRPPSWFSASCSRAGLQFASEDELDRAIDWLWSTPELRELPRIHVGENTIVVPLDAVDLFRQKGYEFVLCRVVSAGDISAEEANRIRREG